MLIIIRMDTLNPSIHLHLQICLHLYPPSPPSSVYMFHRFSQWVQDQFPGCCPGLTHSISFWTLSQPSPPSSPTALPPSPTALGPIENLKKNHLQVFLIWVFPCFFPRDTNHLIIEAWPGKLLWCQTTKSMPGSAVSCMAHGGCRFCRHTSFFLPSFLEPSSRSSFLPPTFSSVQLLSCI